MQLYFSFIIPVFNRPKEIHELLQSFSKLDYSKEYEIVIVEDGSTETADKVIENFNELNITYISKPNTGPGDSRNEGMKHAKGNYFIILDSDCLLPENYLLEVEQYLQFNFVHCFGGPDEAHVSFTSLQKAINFAMTSFISTGGIRGNKMNVSKFQPRSFNMGLSKEAFYETKGFGSIHPGEDPDLSMRLWEKGYETTLIPEAKVFHKRRISWEKYFKQVYKFGLVRPILNFWHPKTKKVLFWFPTLFSIGLITSLIISLFRIYVFSYLYLLYFAIAFIMAMFKTKSMTTSIMAVFAVVVQMIGYGYGFLKSTLLVSILRKEPTTVFPELFFKN